MARTVKELIEGALQRISVLDPDSELLDSDLQTGLDVCNEMLEAWSINNLLIPARTIESFDTTAGGNTFTMGPGGDWDTVRPMYIDIISGIGEEGSDYHIARATAEIWQGISVRNTVARPLWWWFEPDTPLARVRFDSIPDTAESMRVTSYKPLSSLPTPITEETAFPLAYTRAIRLNLAVDLAGEFDMAVSADLAALATQAKKDLETANSKQAVLMVDNALVRRRVFDVEMYP